MRALELSQSTLARSCTLAAPFAVLSASGGFCCKSPFALVIKICFGFTRDFRAEMSGTSSPEDTLAVYLRFIRCAHERRPGAGNYGAEGLYYAPAKTIVHGLLVLMT